MKKPKMILLIVSILCLMIVCFSCMLIRKPTLLRTFEDPLKNNRETAMLYGFTDNAILGIEEIDGKSRAEIKEENKKYKLNDYMLLPGEHVVKIGGYPGPAQEAWRKEAEVFVDGKAIPVTMTKVYPGGTIISPLGGDPYLVCYGEWTLRIMVEAGHVYRISYDTVPIIGNDFSVTPHIRETHHIKFSTDNDHIKTKNQKIVSTIVDFKPRTTSTWKIK